MLSRFLLSLIVTAFFATFSVAAHTAETINKFDVQIVVNADRSLDIDEKIEVNAEGIAIVRGLFRDLPLYLRSDTGRNIKVNYDIRAVMRDGKPEEFEVSKVDDALRIRMGNSDILLTNGKHTYQISYSVPNGARMFENYDELYWNVTGNYWQFPILSASATITLPTNAKIIDLTSFSGSEGATESSVSATQSNNNIALFKSKMALAPQEGITIGVAFQKGALAQPTPQEQFHQAFSDYLPILVSVGLVLLNLLYNYGAWRSVGRDPKSGTIIPRFYPPEGFSPALTQYVHNMGFDGSWKAFSAAIVSLATKGLITIENENKITILTRTSKSIPDSLPSGERVIFDFLDAHQTFPIDTTNGPQLASVQQKFTSTIARENSKRYFLDNKIYAVLSYVIAAASLGFMLLQDLMSIETVFFVAIAAVFVFVTVSITRSLVRTKGIGRYLTILVLGIIVFNSVALLGDIITDISLDFVMISALSICVLAAVFGSLMAAPTVHGRAVMDEIKGFAMYLKTAEKNRLNFEKEPDMSVKRFEAILPYAMALGIEKPWTERFEKDLANNVVQGATATYIPTWYHGDNFEPSRLVSSVAGISSSLGNAMVASQPSSSSSSGFSSGGGFSGGGGGGGGGGGW